MNRTFTPTLPLGVLARLGAYADIFRGEFPMSRQAEWSPVYLRGLPQDGERKSIEPLVARVDLPPQLRVKNPDQCLQNFVNQADRDEQAVWRRYRGHMAETFADPEGRLRHRRHHLPRAGPALRRGPAPALRGPG
jgi:SRSO17 transposase